MTDQPSWLTGMLSKRTPDAVRCLLDLIEAGLRNGRVSANDIRQQDISEPNVIGGVFKTLPRFGFVHTDERVTTTAKRKHARRVDVWELRDRGKAESYVNALRVHLTSINPERKQLTLWEAA